MESSIGLPWTERLQYLDFDLRIGQGEGEYPVEVVQSPAEGAGGTLRLPWKDLELTNQLKSLEIDFLRSAQRHRFVLSQEQQSVRDFGQTLFRALMSERVLQCYEQSRQIAEDQDRGLRLKLRIEAPELNVLPWELLYDPHQLEFVCLSRITPVVRYLELPGPIPVITIKPPLRILGMVVSPANRPLNVRQEKEQVEEALDDLRRKNLVMLHWLSGGTRRDLQREMRRGPWHVFHFVGHGGFDEGNDEGYIVLADHDGKSRNLPATGLGLLLADQPPRLVLLNACHSARGGKLDIFSSTATILMRRNIPAVIGMHDVISDTAAAEFAREFYAALADGMPVDASVVEGRKAVRVAVDATGAWSIPVLYMRSKDGMLFRIEKYRLQVGKQEDTELEQAKVLLKDGRLDAAVAELEQVYRRAPDIAHSFLVRALLAQAQELKSAGDDETALKLCERVFQISPGEEQAQEMRMAIWISRGNEAMKRGALETALAAYQQAGARGWEDALTFVRRLLEKDPDLWQLRLHLGKVMLDLGRIDGAIEELRQVYEMNPAEGKLPLVRALVVGAKMREELGEDEAALAACKHALELVPDHKDSQEIKRTIWTRRGDVALMREEWDNALIAYQKAGAEQKIEELKRKRQRKEHEKLEKDAVAHERATQWARAAEIYQQLLESPENDRSRDDWKTALERVQTELEAEIARESVGGWPAGHILDDRYEIIKQLAVTECNEIYLAKELQPPNDSVVVKRLRRDKIQDEEACGRFEREIIALRQIRHRSVVSLIDTRTVGEDRYLVTEFADRGTLKEYLGSKLDHRLKPIEALAFALSVCEGLGEAHLRQIIHRDIKPGNIFLFSRHGGIQAKIGDFGIVRVPREYEKKKLTQTGLFVGTFDYASPEQVRGERVDSQSDLYSWAVVFFEILTGESPTDSLKDPNTLRPTQDRFPVRFFTERDVPDLLVEVLQRNLSSDPTLRYQTAAELQEALEAALDQIVRDVEKSLTEGEEHIRLLEWESANTKLEHGLTMCEWYGEASLRDTRIEKSELSLKMGSLYVQSIFYSGEQKWQAAIRALEQLRTRTSTYLDHDITARLMRAQKHQLLLEHQTRQDWVEVSRLATELVADDSGRFESEPVEELQSLASYARGSQSLGEGLWEVAYYQFYDLYTRDPNFRDTTEQCMTAAYQNAVAWRPAGDLAHQVEWLERVIEFDADHAEGSTYRQLDEVRLRWAEELLEEGNLIGAIGQLARIQRKEGRARELLAGAYDKLGDQYIRRLHVWGALRAWYRSWRVSHRDVSDET